MSETKRMRIFAGPNGSGKSTIIEIVREKEIDLGLYINADELKVQFDSEGFLDFNQFKITVNELALKDEITNSSFFDLGLRCAIADAISVVENKLYCKNKRINDALSTLTADFIRSKLLGNCNKFTFETVMSHPSKLEYIQQAISLGYKTYLYFVALETPELNVDRVKARVELEGHAVPEDKIVSRYYRTMDLLLDAIKIVDKAYFFDNSTSNSVLFGIYKDGEINITSPARVPQWFHKYVINKLA